MKQLFLVLVNTLTLLGALYVNYFFASGAGGQESVGEISDKYKTLITPAGYAFSIWGLIYLMLVGYVGYQWVEYKRGWENGSLDNSGIWFALSNIFNGIWIVVWTNEWIGLSVLVIFLLLFSLIQLVIRLRLEIWDAPKKIIFFVWWPICIYLGWIVLASVINFAVWINNSGILQNLLSPEIWAVIIIGVAVGVYLLLTFSRNMREASLVGAWGLSALAYRHWDSNNLLVIVALLGAAILVISSGYHAYKNRKNAIDASTIN